MAFIRKVPQVRDHGRANRPLRVRSARDRQAHRFRRYRHRTRHARRTRSVSLEPDQQALDPGVTPLTPVEKPLTSGHCALIEPESEPSQLDVSGRGRVTGSLLLRQVLTDVSN